MNNNYQLLFTATEEQYDLNRIIMASKKTLPEKKPNKKPKKHHFIRLLLVLILILSIVTIGIINQVPTFDEVSIQQEDGTYVLSPTRQAKLDRELERLDNAEQYALIALVAGSYICYNCINTDSIYLNSGEVWKYGITTKGQWGRYPNGFPDSRLTYFIQLEGDLTACMKEEKRKIYNYISLEENLRRTNRLVRPPGNKQDN